MVMMHLLFGEFPPAREEWPNRHDVALSQIKSSSEAKSPIPPVD
jgi:hypothetical protein